MILNRLFCYGFPAGRDMPAVPLRALATALGSKRKRCLHDAARADFPQAWRPFACGIGRKNPAKSNACANAATMPGRTRAAMATKGSIAFSEGFIIYCKPGCN